MRGEQPWKTNRARVLRSLSSGSEGKLWSALRDRRLGGFKFVRQAPIGAYFADFLCRDAKLVIEVDGATHGSEVELASDAARTAALEALGYRVIRVDDIDVMKHLDAVLAMISNELKPESGWS